MPKLEGLASDEYKYAPYLLLVVLVGVYFGILWWYWTAFTIPLTMGFAAVGAGQQLGWVLVLMGVGIWALYLYIGYKAVFGYIFPTVRIVDKYNNRIRYARAVLPVIETSPNMTKDNIKKRLDVIDAQLRKIQDAKKDGHADVIDVDKEKKLQKEQKKWQDEYKAENTGKPESMSLNPFHFTDIKFIYIKAGLFPLRNFFKFRIPDKDEGVMRRGVWALDIESSTLLAEPVWNEDGFYEIGDASAFAISIEDPREYQRQVMDGISNTHTKVGEGIKGDSALRKRKFRQGLPYTPITDDDGQGEKVGPQSEPEPQPEPQREREKHAGERERE